MYSLTQKTIELIYYSLIYMVLPTYLAKNGHFGRHFGKNGGPKPILPEKFRKLGKCVLRPSGLILHRASFDTKKKVVK
jgi:hypothetical protein